MPSVILLSIIIIVIFLPIVIIVVIIIVINIGSITSIQQNYELGKCWLQINCLVSREPEDIIYTKQVSMVQIFITETVPPITGGDPVITLTASTYAPRMVVAEGCRRAEGLC